MKKGIILFAGVLVFVLLFAGFSTKDAKAVFFWTPQSACEDALSTPGYNFFPGGGYDTVRERCLLGWEHEATGAKNHCHPKLDVWQSVWGMPSINSDRDGKTASFWCYEFVGCTGDFIKDPNQGSAKLGGGVQFNYERGTCGNGCNITKFGVTAPAKRALGSLDGKVMNKSYVQIKDDNGALVSGEFSLCFYAKGAKNPNFFRWAGGNTWTPMGGFWEGNNFCMNGNYSGNYVMVDLP